MGIPDLEVHLYHADPYGVRKWLHNYLDHKTPLYDLTEAGKRNNAREWVRWGSDKGFIDIRSPETVSSDYYGKELTLWMAALYHVPGRPITAVKAEKDAVNIRLSKSPWGTNSCDLYIWWKNPALLPFVEGLVEALMVEWPATKPDLDSYAARLKKLRSGLQKQAKTELARLSEENPPDPQQIQQRERQREVFKQWKLKEDWGKVHGPKLAEYAKARGVAIEEAQAHPQWPKTVNPIGDGWELDWDTYHQAAHAVIDETASEANGAAQGQGAEADAGSEHPSESGGQSVATEEGNPDEAAILDALRPAWLAQAIPIWNSTPGYTAKDIKAQLSLNASARTILKRFSQVRTQYPRLVLLDSERKRKAQ